MAKKAVKKSPKAAKPQYNAPGKKKVPPKKMPPVSGVFFALAANAGDVLTWNGSAFEPLPPKVGGRAVSGSPMSAGDLLVYNGTDWGIGSEANAGSLKTVPVSAGAPADGNVLTFSAGSWSPQAPVAVTAGAGILIVGGAVAVNPGTGLTINAGNNTLKVNPAAAHVGPTDSIIAGVDGAGNNAASQADTQAEVHKVCENLKELIVKLQNAGFIA